MLWNENTEKSLAEMIKLAEHVAGNGDAEMMGRLGRAYAKGRGVRKDVRTAREWYSKAASAGVAWARKELDSL